MADDTEATLTGGCQCGAVRYALYQAPGLVSLCHCRMCQKALGNAFAPLATVAFADLAWTKGTPAFYRSSTIAERGFCAACGTPLSFRYIDSESYSVTVGSLDEPERAPPTRHFGIESRLAWLGRIDNLPAVSTEEGMTAAHKAAFTSKQGDG